MEKNKKDKRRLTFGFLIDSVHSGYHRSILSGIVDFVKEKNINLLCFVTGRLESHEYWESSKNILFDLVDKSNIDGLIVMTAAIRNIVSKNNFAKFLKKYYPIPIVSIAEKISNYPSLIINNEKGLMDLLGHLVNTHSYKKLAFITGPKENLDSQSRLKIYKKFLKTKNIPYDPNLVVNGSFTGISGRNAVKILLKERKANFDVIIAANDDMALGAIEELAFLDIQVPGDVFVVGFDDIEASKNSSLTTIKQPLHKQGYTAAEIIFKKINNEKYDLINILPTELVIRESCGCYSPNVLLSPIWNIPIIEKSKKEPFTINKDEIIDNISKSISNISPEIDKYAKKWIENLFNAFINSYKKLKPEIFLTSWNKIIFEATVNKLNFSFLQRIITSLRKNTLYGNDNDKQKIFFEDLFHQARIMLEEAEQKSEALQKIILTIQKERLNIIGGKLTDACNLKEQLNVIYQEFPILGIKKCYISLFEDPKKPLEKSRLVLAYNESRRITITNNGIVFPTKELIPKLYYPKASHYNFLIESLFHRDNHLGIILMELGDKIKDVSVYDSLCTKISSTLRLIMQYEKTISQAQNLEIINKKLKHSNQQLQEFASVASHDLQEPLRKINIFGNQLIKKSYLNLDEHSRDYLYRMQNAAKRMQTLIHDLLIYSRVSTTKKLFTPVDLSKIIKMILSDFELQISKTLAKIKIEPLPVIESNPTQMQQLFQNLISNALKFHKPDESPQIKIYPLKNTLKEYCVIIVEDNGIGIEKENYDKIFGIFQRVYSSEEYKGSGIGLAICKNIIENHEGSIHIESKLGQGTKFIISLPVKQKNKS